MSCLLMRRSVSVLHAPDGGLPGIPGSGPGSGLSGIPGGAGGTPPPGPAQAPVFLNPEPQGDPGSGTFELSGWWRRVGAVVIDAVILLVLIVPLAIAAFALSGVRFSEGDGSGDTRGIVVLLLIFLVWVLASLLYAPITMAKLNGATLGKKALGIRVMRADGQPMTFGSAAVREVVIKGLLFGVISNLTIGLFYLLDVLWPLWDSEHRALHDMLAKTRVVRG